MPADPGRGGAAQGLQGPGGHGRRGGVRPDAGERREPGSSAARSATGVEYALLPKKTRGETVNLTLTLRFGNEPSRSRGRRRPPTSSGAMLTAGDQGEDPAADQGRVRQAQRRRLASTPTPGVLTVTVADQAGEPAGRADAPSGGAAGAVVPGGRVRHPQAGAIGTTRQGPDRPAARWPSNALQRKLAPYPPDDVAVRRRRIPEASSGCKAADRRPGEGAVRARSSAAAAGQLAVVGDFDPDAAVEGVRRRPWRAGSLGQPRTSGSRSRPRTRSRGMEVILTPDKANAVYLAALPVAVTDADPAYPAAGGRQLRPRGGPAGQPAEQPGPRQGGAVLRRRVAGGGVGRRAERAVPDLRHHQPEEHRQGGHAPSTRKWRSSSRTG